ncbi:MAG TPA: SRPBCC family protein [Acidimicrobiales bacterium]|nr:SRPBCC family protein [Acidimicrobiales bacterium]
MNSANAVEIGAPAELVWDVFTAVERWPHWTPTVTEAVGLDGPAIAVGNRFAITQPRLPRLVWEVTEVDPGTSWTWRARAFGAESLAGHDVTPIGAERTVVRQRIAQRGVLGVLSAITMRRLVRRYLALEAGGLKRHVEDLYRSGATSS